MGFIVSIAARSTNMLLKMASNGMVECSGPVKQPPDLDCQFEVVGPAGAQPNAIRLHSVAYPQFYLAIVNGYFIGYVRLLCESHPCVYRWIFATIIVPPCNIIL